MNYPFSALVGQESLKQALILNVVDPSLSGVLIRGEKGTAKSTAVRGLADLLPSLEVAQGCVCNCEPEPNARLCPECAERWVSDKPPTTETIAAKVVELPVGSTEDRVLGSLDLEAAVTEGRRAFSPGLLAAANRNILYVDEVNLLDDHLVDILLDSAAMGVNAVEREGVSYQHPARFTLVGTMNPEEGELRPQLLDRFGLCVRVKGVDDPDQRAEVIRRRLAYEADAEGFIATWQGESEKIRKRIIAGKDLLSKVGIPDEALQLAIRISLAVGTDGHRADLVTVKAARAVAAYEARRVVEPRDILRAAELALPHRLKRQPFEEMVFDLKPIMADLLD